MLVHRSFAMRVARRRAPMPRRRPGERRWHEAPGREGEVQAAVALVAAGVATAVTIANVDATSLAAFAGTTAAAAGVVFHLRHDGEGGASLEFRALRRG